MSSEKSERSETVTRNKFLTNFKAVLGGVILTYMVYHYLRIEPFDNWLFVIPGLLLGIDIDIKKIIKSLVS